MSTGKVSFTIRRPSPVSRASSSDAESFKIPSLPRHISNGNGTSSPLVRSTTNSPKPNSRTYHDRGSDSSHDEDSEDELVTGFDQFGVQRLNEKKKQQKGPLIIPPLQNKDWRDLARKRKSAGRYIPASAQAVTGKDGSVGGLGTRDIINSGPVISGLQVGQKRIKVEVDVDMECSGTQVKEEEVTEETEDQAAIRALLSGTVPTYDVPLIDIIPQPVTETDAYKQDVEELPDQATLDDYARVPVSQFGAALLRGMGWKEGTAATRDGKKGMVEPWTPAARPALLGIGAKERETFDDGSSRKGGSGGGANRPERRYVPVVKKEREGSERREGSGSASGSNSRRRSPAPRRGELSVSRRGSRSPSPVRKRSRDDRAYERRDERGYDNSNRGQKDRDSRRSGDGDRGRSESSSRRDRDRRDYCTRA